MIFYFTGTGNSLMVAKELASKLDEKVVSIPEIINSKTDLTFLDNEKQIGIVFPIYAWGAPDIIYQFCDMLSKINTKDKYIYVVATCGGSCGAAYPKLNEYVTNLGLHLNSWFWIKMTDNYIIMFNVDNKETIDNTIVATKKTIESIANYVKSNTNQIWYKRGVIPSLLTKVINPMFSKNSLKNIPKKFYVTEKCNNCGICAKVCPVNNITIESKPVWSDNCTSCLACINWCPHRAIECGKSTVKKGRYTNPEIKVTELMKK